MGLLRPFEVLDVFGGKSKFWAPMTLIFGTKRVLIEVNNWWNFGVDISNHFWLILIWPFCSSNSFPTRYKNSFWKLFLSLVGRELERQNGQFWKWLEISTPKFHHLYISMETWFSPNLKVLGAKEMDFPPKMFKTSNGRSGDIFWATPSKFGEISFL